MVESACGLGCLVLGWFFGVFVPFSTICLSSLPSTMTWAPCPHGVRTRGKKNGAGHGLLLGADNALGGYIKVDRFEDLEDQVMDYLVSELTSKCLSAPSIFCKLPRRHTQRTQSGTSYSKAWNALLSSGTAVQSCHRRNNLKMPYPSCSAAVHVPMNPEEIVPEGAFAGVPRLRHVSVESGIRLIGAEAWQNCRQLPLSNCRPLW